MEEGQNESLINLLLGHWAQLTVLITATFGSIGYIFQKYFDWRYKEREIKFSRQYDERNLLLKRFLKTYHLYRLNMTAHHNYKYKLKKEEKAQEYYLKAISVLPDLLSDLDLLKVFFSENVKEQAIALKRIFKNYRNLAFKSDLQDNFKRLNSELIPKELEELLVLIKKEM